MNQVVIATGAGAGTAGVRTALVTYRDQGAERAVDSVQTAVKACATGFTATLNGSRTRFTVTPDTGVGGGQQRIGVVLTSAWEGSAETNDVWLIRTGNVVAYFVATGLHGEGVPQAAMTTVVAPQMRRLSQEVGL